MSPAVANFTDALLLRCHLISKAESKRLRLLRTGRHVGNNFQIEQGNKMCVWSIRVTFIVSPKKKRPYMFLRLGSVLQTLFFLNIAIYKNKNSIFIKYHGKLMIQRQALNSKRVYMSFTKLLLQD